MINKEIDLSIVIPTKVFDQSLINCLASILKAKDYYLSLKKSEVEIEINVILKEKDISKARDYFKNEKDVNFFSQGKILRGESHARNIGINNCCGKIIAFTDHDCVVSRNWIDEILDRFNEVKNNPKVVCVLGNHWLYQTYSIWLKLYSKYRQDHATEHIKKEGHLFFIDRLDGRNFAILAEVARKFHFREDVPAEQDREFGLQLIKRGYKILFNNEMVVYHEPLTLKQIIGRQYSYGIGSARWRTTPNWFYRFYIFHIKRFLNKEISLNQTIFTMLCNVLYQLGRLKEKLRNKK